MYNRYIPQADGSYRRNRVQETAGQTPRRHERPAESPQQKPQPVPPPQTTCEAAESIQPTFKSDPPRQAPSENVGGFLRQLLPKDFDSSDLIIVLLLLLMAGNSEEDRTTALLTLALYFGM